jgi:hypothetical protein
LKFLNLQGVHVIGAEDNGDVKQLGYIFVPVDWAKNGIIYRIRGLVS